MRDSRDTAPHDPPTPEPERGRVNTDITESISNSTFNAWYHDRQIAENILNGKLYFNGLTPPPEPEKHSPSKLLQCHRKIAYRQENAPQEGAAPQGLFWAGERFEEDIMVPFLQAVATDEDTYVQNSKWIDVTIEEDDTDLHLKGVTDPVIVTEDGIPLLVTEIKTKRSLDTLTEPNPHHRAQLHAYLYALNREYDRDVNTGLIIYGSRTTLDIDVFEISFDDEFWAAVQDWMAAHTAYRDDNDIPPAAPEMDWECSVCSFKHRCGQSDVPYADEGYDGLLPGFDGYRKRRVAEYLEAREDAGLTPTLAYEYPELAETYTVKDWECTECGATFSWDEIPDPRSRSHPPVCKHCAEFEGQMKTLQVPVRQT